MFFSMRVKPCKSACHYTPARHPKTDFLKDAAGHKCSRVEKPFGPFGRPCDGHLCTLGAMWGMPINQMAAKVNPVRHNLLLPPIHQKVNVVPEHSLPAHQNFYGAMWLYISMVLRGWYWLCKMIILIRFLLLKEALKTLLKELKCGTWLVLRELSGSNSTQYLIYLLLQ